MSEQEIIEKYFSKHQRPTETVALSVGDDAAIVNPPEDSELVITTDTLNVGVHFYQDCKAEYVGHKSLAVSLSDIAAMGATPLWATVNVSLPNINHPWLKEFSNGLFALADKYKVKIVGGDLVKGPLSITIQLIGNLSNNKKLLRSACKPGDLIYVSGFIGDASLGLKLVQNNYTLQNASNHEYFMSCLQTPIPRLDISEYIANFAHAAIDISDGFLVDLQRILTSSNVSAEIELDQIPVSNAMQAEINTSKDIKNLLIGGEDYELIFTINENDKDKLERFFNDKDLVVSEVGAIMEGSGISLLHHGKPCELPATTGFDHFI